MRFLKNKIAQATASRTGPKEKALEKTIVLEEILPRSPAQKKRTKIPGQCITPEASRETKNIAKNYGKAICKFSTSPLAMSYLDDFLLREGVKLKGYTEFVNKNKRSIVGLHHFRTVLLPDDNDDRETAAYKRVFREIGAVFIKFFSVNWIYHSKVQHKKAHLNFRFKMLRRIRNPELFTYLKVTRGNKKNEGL